MIFIGETGYVAALPVLFEIVSTLQNLDLLL